MASKVKIPNLGFHFPKNNKVQNNKKKLMTKIIELNIQFSSYGSNPTIQITISSKGFIKRNIVQSSVHFFLKFHFKWGTN